MTILKVGTLNSGYRDMSKKSALEKIIQTGSAAILAALGDAISIQDTELRIIYQNNAHISLMGSHPGEFCYAAYQGKTDPCPGCHLLESFKDGLIHRREASTDRPGRGRMHVEIISTPLMNDNGEIIGGVESVRDITDRVMVEEKLVKHVTAIEASMDGIAILNSKGEYTFLNHAHAAIYGYNAPAELLGKSWRLVYGSDELERFQQDIFPYFMKNGNWRGEAVGRRKDGTSFPQELSLALTADRGIVCVVRDVTERKRADELFNAIYVDLQKKASDLKAVNSELEAFSYTLSHDVRNYLTRISLAAQALTENYSQQLDETGGFFVAGINEACDGMENLIQAILLLSRISKTDTPHDTVDLSELAIEAGIDVRYLYPERQVNFTVQPGLKADGNRELLKIMLLNLLGNAWKYTAPAQEARVTFGCEEQAGNIVFFVRDNGAGFDMTEAEKLFKPFSRLGTALDYKGIGIGLATVQRIVHAHGGEIWGEGEPGKGATFYFTLPSAGFENLSECSEEQLVS